VKVSSNLGVRTGGLAVAGILLLSGCSASGEVKKTQSSSTTSTVSPVTTPPPSTAPPSTGPPSTPAPTVPDSYVVQKGDSLDHIAKQFGVTVAQLVAANKIKNPDHIEAGQRLTIPPATAVPAAPASTAPASTPASKQGVTSTTTHR
jgi:LysM repeat protein